MPHDASGTSVIALDFCNYFPQMLTYIVWVLKQWLNGIIIGS